MYMSIEPLLGSKTTLRILKILMQHKELNISGIARRANINHKVAKERLLLLIAEGIVREKRFGRIRIFELNFGDERVRALREILGDKPTAEVSVF